MLSDSGFMRLLASQMVLRKPTTRLSKAEKIGAGVAQAKLNKAE
jgi:hypothetical protein